MITNFPRFIADLEKFGAKTDATVAEQLQIVAAARAVAQTQPLADLQAAYGTLTPDNAAQAIIDAATLAAGSQRIQEASNVVIAAAGGTLRRWVGAHEDEIVKAMRPTWDKAAEVVHAAGRHFPPGASPEFILRGGAAAATAYEGLSAALDVLAQVRSLRVEVADCRGGEQQSAEWYITGAEDLDHLDTARRAYHGGGSCWHALAHAGFTLRLNTKAEAAKVAAGARSVSDAREQAAREARSAEIRESWPGLFPKTAA